MTLKNNTKKLKDRFPKIKETFKSHGMCYVFLLQYYNSNMISHFSF